MPDLFSMQVTKSGQLFREAEAVGVVDEALNKSLTGAAAFLAGQIKLAAPVGVTSALRGSILWSVSSLAGEARVFTPLEYALPIERGRKAAWPPLDPILLWVKRKLGISDEKQARNVAFLICRKLGTARRPGDFFFEKAVQKNEREIQRAFFEPLGLNLTLALDRS